MFSLVKGLYDIYARKEQYSIIIIGLNNAGKTTLLERIKTIYLNTPAKQNILPTVGMNIANLDFPECKIKLWDLGGAVDLHSIWTKYYKDCHAIMFVIDSTDKDRLTQAKDVLLKVSMDESLEGIPLLIAANKQDLKESLEIHDIKEILNPVFSHFNARESQVMAVSAISGLGVKDSTDWLIAKCKLNEAARPPLLT